MKPNTRTLSSAFLSSLMVAVVLIGGCTLPEVRRAEQLANAGNWDGAVAAYREALKKEPFDETIQQRLDQAKARAAEQHYAEGRRFLKENRLPEALYAFKQALGLDPSRSEHHAALHDALRLKEAQTQLQTADKLKGLGRLPPQPAPRSRRRRQRQPSSFESLSLICEPPGAPYQHSGRDLKTADKRSCHGEPHP